MSHSILSQRLLIFLLYVLLVFPLFYFVYKFGVLLEGYRDAISYLKLFENWQDPDVPCPFNMRLLSPLLINLLHKTGIFYNTECAIDAFPQYDKTYFFSNILFNFICVVLTCYSLFIVFTRLGFSIVLSFLGGTFSLLGFGTIFYMMMPGVDALSVLIFTWAMFFYFKRSYWTLALLPLFILQREYYFLFFLLVSFMDYFKFGRQKYQLYVLAVSFICWTVYFILRKYIFLTPHWHYQTSGGNLMSNLLAMNVDVLTMFRQSFMTMNLTFIYFLVLIYKKLKGFTFSAYYLWMFIFLFIQITVLSIATTSGNNNGRYLCFTSPFILYLILMEISPMIKIEISSQAGISRTGQ